MNRTAPIDEALELITGERAKAYGEPPESFGKIVSILNTLDYRRDGNNLKGHDFAIIMMVAKLVRLGYDPSRMDNWTDIVGYDGCGWECVASEQDAKEELIRKHRKDVADSLARTAEGLDY